MFDTIKKISTLLIAVVFLSSTLGLSMYYHHCNQTGYSQLSYTEDHIHCTHNNETHTACCSVHQHDNKDHSIAVHKSNAKNCLDDNCCSTENIILKIQNLYLDNTEIINFSFCKDFPTRNTLNINLDIAIQATKQLFYTDVSPPPLLFGKALNIFFSRLKIDL